MSADILVKPDFCSCLLIFFRKIFFKTLHFCFQVKFGMDQSNMTILNSSVPIHSPNMSNAKRKNNRHTSHNTLQTERLTLGDEAKMVSLSLMLQQIY